MEWTRSIHYSSNDFSKSKCTVVFRSRTMRTFQQFTEEVQRALKKRDEKSKREKKVDKLKSDSSHWKGLE